MLDTISGGRLVAGMPLGTAMDATLCAGITPIEQRERYYEAHDLILKAWTADDIFAWNGKYYQLPKVNVWPRPIQQPVGVQAHTGINEQRWLKEITQHASRHVHDASVNRSGLKART